MWQEARKQEKHIKTLMVDYKRRAERRRDYYERIKQDPIKFLRVFGRSSKLHLDSEVTKRCIFLRPKNNCDVILKSGQQISEHLDTYELTNDEVQTEL
ncbi:unnamed protein product [Trichobilharzia regenti]|nr:unnamed protein product [Trichobilharzia regenti]